MPKMINGNATAVYKTLLALVNNGFINKHSHVEIKKTALVPSVELSKHGENVQIKRLAELDVFFGPAFQLAKACGIETPDKEVKLIANEFYLFTKKNHQSSGTQNISHQKLGSFIENYSNYFDAANLQLSIGKQPDGRFASEVKIDKTSVARFLLLAAILQLDIVNPKNIDIIITTDFFGFKKAEFGMTKDRLTLRQDCSAQIEQILKYSSSKSLSETVQDVILAISKDQILASKLCTFLTDDDYRLAFQKIEKNFLAQHNNLLSNGMLDKAREVHLDRIRIGDESIFKETMESFHTRTKAMLTTTWPDNFKALQSKIHAIQMKVQPGM